MGSLTELLSKIQPAVYQEKETTDPEYRNSGNEEFVENVATLNVRRSVKNIVDRSHILEQMIEQGEIAIIGAKLHIESGAVEFYEDTLISSNHEDSVRTQMTH